MGLFTWLLFVSALAITATMSGVIIGLAARSQRLSSKWIDRMAFYANLLLLTTAGLLQEHMHLPYPPQLLADSGYAFVALLGSVLLILQSCLLAKRIARKLATGY